MPIELDNTPSTSTPSAAQRVRASTPPKTLGDINHRTTPPSILHRRRGMAGGGRQSRQGEPRRRLPSRRFLTERSSARGALRGWLTSAAVVLTSAPREQHKRSRYTLFSRRHRPFVVRGDLLSSPAASQLVCWFSGRSPRIRKLDRRCPPQWRFNRLGCRGSSGVPICPGDGPAGWPGDRE